MNLADLTETAEAASLRDAMRRAARAGADYPDRIGLWSMGISETLGGYDPGAAVLQALLEETGQADGAMRWPEHLAGCLALRLAEGRVATDTLQAAARGAVIGVSPRSHVPPPRFLLSAGQDGILRLRDAMAATETEIGLQDRILVFYRNWVSLPVAVGIARDLVERTVAFVRLRRQFGQTLSTFQAVQHALADMWVAAEEMSALALTARHTDPENSFSLDLAWVGAVPRARAVAQAAVQLHGGTGMAEEAGIAPRFRALWALTLGHATDERARVALEEHFLERRDRNSPSVREPLP